MTPFGSTALHDALDKAAHDIATHGEGRRAVVVLTDGIDTSSQAAPDDVIARSRALDVPIYAVSVVSPLDDPAAKEFAGDKGQRISALRDRDARALRGALGRRRVPGQRLRGSAAGGRQDRIGAEAPVSSRVGPPCGRACPLSSGGGRDDPQGRHGPDTQRLRSTVMSRFAIVVSAMAGPSRRGAGRFDRRSVVRKMIAPLLVAGVALAAAGCAKKSYVQREVSEVSKKVDAVSAEVEKTQQRVQQNEVRIDAVDKSAQAGIGEAKGSAQAAMTKAAEAEKAAKGKLIYTRHALERQGALPREQGRDQRRGQGPDRRGRGAARRREPRRLLRDRGPHGLDR